MNQANILITPDDEEKLRELAEKRGCSKNAVIRYLIRKEAKE